MFRPLLAAAAAVLAFAAPAAAAPYDDAAYWAFADRSQQTQFDDRWDEQAGYYKPRYAAFEYMLSYSPYDNVEAKAYPPMLVTAGLNDPRVTYWEPAKWAAKLRVTKTDNNLLLLKINMGAGHGGKSGRWNSLHEIAEAYAFVVTQMADA